MPKVLQQGEDYKGDETPEEQERQEEKANGPEQDETGKDKLPQNMKLLVAVLGCVAILFVVILIVIISKKGGFSDDAPAEEIVENDDALFNELMANAGAGEAIDTTESDYAPFGDTDDFSSFDSSDDSYVQDEDSSGTYLGDDEALNLRKYGYTADEIEWARANGITYQSLIDSADQAANELAEAKIEEMSDTGSDAYKRLRKLTWLGGKKLKLKEVKPDEMGNYDIWATTSIVNGDYTKCGQRGRQLFLCIETKEYGNVFMYIPPKRWMQLEDTGNIVVEITVDHYNGQEVVTNVQEVDTGDHPDPGQENGNTGASFGEVW